MRYQEMTIEGRNAVAEALRAGKPIDRLFIQDHCQDGPVLTIKRLARAKEIPVKYVEKERLDQLSETGRHQGVIAYAAAYEYAQVEDMLAAAQEKGERLACIEARARLPWYLKGVAYSSAWKQKLVRISTLDELRSIARDIALGRPPIDEII